MELEVELHYFMARSHLPGFNYMKCHADLKSEKPLTIGDAIDHVLKPKRVQIRNHEGEFTGIMEDVTAAEKIEELEKQHNCRFMLSDVHFTLSLNDTKVCRQFFTEAEYVRYKPNPKERSSRQTGKRERTLRTTSDFRKHHYCLSILVPSTSTATSLRYGGRFVSVVSCDRADIHEHD